MRVLGVDLGSKRIGLAVSDERGEIAFPAGILDSRGRRRDLDALARWIAERGVERVVIGLPVHMDGRRGPEAERAVAFADALAEHTGLPVETLDERWTSAEAERLLETGTEGASRRGRGGRRDSRSGATAARRDRQRRRGAVDEMAASILLRTYLARRGSMPSPELQREDGAG